MFQPPTAARFFGEDATRGDRLLRQPAVLRAHNVLETALAASTPATWTAV